MGCDRPGGQDQQLGFYLGSRMETTEGVRWQNINRVLRLGLRKWILMPITKVGLEVEESGILKTVTRFGVITEMWMKWSNWIYAAKNHAVMNIAS